MCAIVYSVCNYPTFHLTVCLYNSSVKYIVGFSRCVSYLHSLSAMCFLVNDIMCIWKHINSSHMLASRTFLLFAQLRISVHICKCACFSLT